jgi:hypothetical protein
MPLRCSSASCVQACPSIDQRSAVGLLLLNVADSKCAFILMAAGLEFAAACAHMCLSSSSDTPNDAMLARTGAGGHEGSRYDAAW